MGIKGHSENQFSVSFFLFSFPSFLFASTTTNKMSRLGTDENPLETGYYDLLDIPINADAAQIKKSYR